MPPALHPRSIFTTSLFSTTLAVSFIVVGLPHIVPCPVDTSQYAEGRMEGFDTDGRRRIRRRKVPPPTEEQNGGYNAEQRRTPVPAAASTEGEAKTASATDVADSAGETLRRTRECPVPKPSGVIGQLLGFKKEEAHDDRSKPSVRVSSAEQHAHRPMTDLAEGR